MAWGWRLTRIARPTCSHCGCFFIPKPKGYNAKYCSGRCKNKARKLRMAPEARRAQRQRRHARVKADPDRLERHRAQGRASAKKPREWLAEYKLARGCADCGYREYSAALQLDHTGVKSVEISEARSSVARLIEEIEKGECVVRCANCHAVKTWRDKQKGKKS